jgi:iron complex outermembrane receptor protein
MKKIITIITILLSVGLLQAQNGHLKGSVKAFDNRPIADVTILILRTQRGTTTNKFGEYEIKDIKSGNYNLKISSIGYVSQNRIVTIEDNQTFSLPLITLIEARDQLDEVLVDGKSINKFVTKESFYVSKMSLTDIENPQAYNSISNILLKEQVVTNLNDAIKNATGVTRLWESTGRGGDGAEYYTLRGFSVQPSLTNGLPGLNNGGLDPSNIERIEVIKGPSGTLYGSSLISYGGLINIVTKQPYETFGGEVSYTSGSYGLNRITADINTPLGDGNDIFLRINTAFHTENSFQDAGMNTSFYFAPSLKFVASEKLSFIVNTEILKRKSVNAPMLFLNRSAPISFDNINVFEQNYKNSFTSNNLSIENPTFNLQAQAIYKLSDKWTSQTVLSTGKTTSDGYYSYLWDLNDGNTFGHNLTRLNNETRTTDIQQNFIGDFKIGNLRNRMVVGLDYFQTNLRNNGTGWVGIGEVTLDDGISTAVLSQAAVDNILADASVSNSESEQETYSAYFSDVLNLTSTLSAMVSLRVDFFKGNEVYTYQGGDDETNDDQIAFSPKFGLVYQPIKDKLSVFANYMNGFSNVAPQEVSDADGTNPSIKSFDPEKANQSEIGLKVNLFKSKLAATISYYNINVSNALMTDPNNINNSIQGGEIESKGFELSLIANPLEGLNIIAGFSHNNSEVIKDTEGAGYLGLRPENAGPEDLINFWTSYTAQSGNLKGFGIGFGGNYASAFNTLNRSTSGSFELPSYTILNSSLSYSKDKYRIILKLDNIANTKCFTGWSTVSPQKLRSIAANFTYKF